MTNPDSVVKSRNITLSTKVPIVKVMIFPVVMYGCESWIIKKAECQRTDTFKLWCWGRLLKVPWTARRSNQSILREINPSILIGRTDAEAKTLVFWSSDANSRLIGKVPDAGQDWGQKEKRAAEDEMAGWPHQCNGHELGQTPVDSEGQGGLAVHGITKSQTQLDDWTITEIYKHSNICASFFTFQRCLQQALYSFYYYAWFIHDEMEIWVFKNSRWLTDLEKQTYDYQRG